MKKITLGNTLFNESFNLLKKKFDKIFLSFFWILCFLPLNINPVEFSRLDIFAQSIFIIPQVICFCFIIYLLKANKFEIKNNKNNFFKKIFIFYVIILSIFIFFNLNINSYLNIFWGSLMLLPYIYISFFHNNLDQLKFFLLSSIFLLFAVYIFYLIKILNIMMIQGDLIHFYGTYVPKIFEHLNSYLSPRSSGMARMSFLLSIFFTFYLIFEKSNYPKTLKILIILLNTFGLLFQSRTMTFIFFFLMITLFIIIILKKSFLKIKTLLLLVFVPIIMASSYNYYLNINSSIFKDHNQKKNIIINKFVTNTSDIILRKKLEADFSSNRFNNWSKILQISKKNFIKGFGFQSDKIIINQSAHSVYFYSLICGGLISLILIIAISLRCFWTSIFILYNFIFSDTKNDTIYLLSTLIIIIFLLRGILETSYGIYSIDYLFFINCFFINELRYKNL